MENETFTFVVCSHVGHTTEQRFMNRREADKHFDELVLRAQSPDGLFVGYYCASVGGLVNAHCVP